MNLRVRAIEQRQSFELPAWQVTETLQETLTAMLGLEKSVPVINRAGLNVKQKIKGPVLITETSSTTWLAEGWCAVVDPVGNLLFQKS